MLPRFSASFMGATVLFFLTLASVMTNSHAAKVYHWVDADGKSHFSENSPRKVQAEKMNIQTAGKGTPSSLNSSSKNNKNSDKKAAQSEKPATELKPEVSPEDKATYCQQSRELLQQMNGNVQRRFEQPDGSYRKLTPAEMSDYKAQAQAGISNFCQ